MDIQMLAVIGTVASTVGGFVAGVVASYLFLRANPNKKAVVDAEVSKLNPKN